MTSGAGIDATTLTRLRGLQAGPGGERPLRSLDASGDGLGEVLDYPEPIAVDASGNVFVGGVQSDNVLRWSASRGVELVLDGDGLTDGIDSPQAVARDGDGNVFVASSADDEAGNMAAIQSSLVSPGKLEYTRGRD